MKFHVIVFGGMRWLLPFVLTASTLFSGSATANTVVFDNFGGLYNPGVGAAIYQNYSSGTDTQAGYMFTPSSTGVLQDVTLPLFLFASTSPSLPSIAHARVMVFDYVDGHPGAELIGSDIAVGESVPLGPPYYGTTTVAFSEVLTLNQGQPYWLIVDALDPGTALGWQYVDDYLNTSAIGAQREVGSPWTIYQGNGGEGAFQVTVTAVPLPSALMLFLSALPLVTLGLRRSVGKI